MKSWDIMSDKLLNRQSAWAWYDNESLKLLHIGFHENSYDDPGLDKLEIDYNTALDIASGKSHFHQYEIVKAGKNLALYFKRLRPATKKFWSLLDPQSNQFSSKFDSAENSKSPVEIKNKDSSGFMASLVGDVKNVIFYITMKNDPNYLIKKLDFWNYANSSGSITDIKIPVESDVEYSIYVRYDAT